jgi:hypothetical protein
MMQPLRYDKPRAKPSSNIGSIRFRVIARSEKCQDSAIRPIADLGQAALTKFDVRVHTPVRWRCFGLSDSAHRTPATIDIIVIPSGELQNTNCFVSHASAILRLGRGKSDPTGKSEKTCPALARKIFHLTSRPNHRLIWLVPPDERGGSRSSRTRGGMRWTRKLRLTSVADAYGESVWF